ncbi:MAG: trypsin-like peptidase domain-containing protein [Elusimicrobiales bacterium]|nr:trypsin-like peptidase domain-containing protein [Elusimicrobiales bacterium]
MKTILLLACLFFPAIAAAQGAADLQLAFNSAAARAGPAVVSVQVIKEETQSVWEPDFFFGYSMPSEKVYRYNSAGLGSGAIIDKRGYVVTNLHVVEGAVNIKIMTQDAKGVEKEWPASFVGSDPALDIALLRIKGEGPFPWLDLNGKAALKVGDFVLAVGYPFGFKQTVTSGIISALNASLPVAGRRYEKLIQTDAAVNYGNSGGPLLNLKGEVVGINTAIASPTGVFAGMGFAVPASEIKIVLEDLLAGRKVKRGWLGLALAGLDPLTAARLGFAGPGGAVVNVAIPGAPAYRAGIRRGDIIFSCDGVPVENNEDLFLETYSRRPGDEVELVYQSGGVKKKVKVKLGERETVLERITRHGRAGPRAAAPGDLFEWEGLSLIYEDGALVAGISEESRLAGSLRRGDLIKTVNGISPRSAGDLEKVFSSASLYDGVVFDLVRNGESLSLSIQSK